MLLKKKSNQWSYKLAHFVTYIVPHFVTKTIEGQLDFPSPRSFFPKSSDQHFEITILISIDERSSNHASGDNTALQVPRDRAISYEICVVFTYSICYWEVNRYFWRRVIFLWGRIFCGEIFKGRIFNEEGSFQGWIFKGKLHTG